MSTEKLNKIIEKYAHDKNGKKETKNAHGAFLEYAEMGRKRYLKKLEKKLANGKGKYIKRTYSEKTLARYSKRWNWVERTYEYDRLMDKIIWEESESLRIEAHNNVAEAVKTGTNSLEKILKKQINTIDKLSQAEEKDKDYDKQLEEMQKIAKIASTYERAYKQFRATMKTISYFIDTKNINKFKNEMMENPISSAFIEAIEDIEGMEDTNKIIDQFAENFEEEQ